MKDISVDKTSAVIHHDTDYKSHYECVETLHQISVIDSKEKSASECGCQNRQDFSESEKNYPAKEHFFGKGSDYYKRYES